MNYTIILFLLFSSCLFLAAQEADDSLEVKKLLGEAYMISKDYKNAEEEYEALLKEHPQDTKIRLQYADMLSWQKKQDKALEEYRLVLQQKPDDLEVMVKLSRALIQGKKYEEAFPLLEKILKMQPDNTESLEAYADLLSYTQQYEKAISEYQKILKKSNRPEVLKKLGDVLSWVRQYEEALRAYDQVLSQKTDFNVLLQKARVLGWMQRWDEGLQMYGSLNTLCKSPLYELEMKGKKAYWNRQYGEAEKIYKELLTIDPENFEARFDLSQIYFYSGEYDLSNDEFEKILHLSPTHFRAKEGLEKSKIMTQDIRLDSEVELYKANSVDRATDIDRKSLFLSVDYPFKSWLRFNASLRQNQYDFKQSNLKTRDVKTGFTFYDPPYFYGNFFYKGLNGQDSIEDLGKAGIFLQGKVCDLFQWDFFSERNRLDNSEEVLRQSLYSDDLKAKILFVLNRNWDLGLEYQHSELSDSNTLENPAVFMEYIRSFEPRRFSAEYRLEHKRYDFTTPEYFSPDHFSTHFLYLHWKQYLNKNEIFSGSDNLYYRLTPGFSYDSEDIAGYSVEGEAGWDLNKKFNVNIKARFSDLEEDIYEDRYVKISAVWYL